MAKISDMIEDLINQMIQDNSGSVEISRNELAEHSTVCRLRLHT